MTPIKLDDRDIKILAILSREGRISKSDLAKRVNLSATPCWERLSRLEKAGIISGYRADIELKNIAPQVSVFVMAELENHRAATFQAFEQAVECCATISSTSGIAITFSIPRPISPSTRAARRPNRIVTGGEGVYIDRPRRQPLLDAFAGLYCVNIGYGRQEVAEAIAAQARELAYYHAYVGHGTEASITLAKMVMDRAPDHMSRVYFGLGGSDANETNVKLVWYYNNILGRPEKKKIISRWRGYHGSGLMTGSLTGLELFHKKFDLPLAQVLHTEAPYYFRRDDASMSEADFSAHCAAELEALIEREGADTIAAFIGEPVLGTGGIVPPPAGYWAGDPAVLKKHDILLIADEVVTGFGRLGTMFGSDPLRHRRPTSSPSPRA
jgi:DNA-binding Lrp family transcriptional regulator